MLFGVVCVGTAWGGEDELVYVGSYASTAPVLHTIEVCCACRCPPPLLWPQVPEGDIGWYPLELFPHDLSGLLSGRQIASALGWVPVVARRGGRVVAYILAMKQET